MQFLNKLGKIAEENQKQKALIATVLIPKESHHLTEIKTWKWENESS